MCLPWSSRRELSSKSNVYLCETSFEYFSMFLFSCCRLLNATNWIKYHCLKNEGKKRKNRRKSQLKPARNGHEFREISVFDLRHSIQTTTTRITVNMKKSDVFFGSNLRLRRLYCRVTVSICVSVCVSACPFAMLALTEKMEERKKETNTVSECVRSSFSSFLLFHPSYVIFACDFGLMVSLSLPLFSISAHRHKHI